MPCSWANSRMALERSADRMSLAGTKWSLMRMQAAGSATRRAPIFRKTSMDRGAVTSVAMILSTLQVRRSPGRPPSIGVGRQDLLARVWPIGASLRGAGGHGKRHHPLPPCPGLRPGPGSACPRATQVSTARSTRRASGKPRKSSIMAAEGRPPWGWRSPSRDVVGPIRGPVRRGLCAPRG